MWKLVQVVGHGSGQSVVKSCMLRPTYVQVPVMIHLYPRFELQTRGIVRLKIVYDRLLTHFPLVSHFTFYA